MSTHAIARSFLFNPNPFPSSLNSDSRVEGGNNGSNNHRPPIQNRTFFERHKKKIGVVAGVLSAGALFIPGAAELVGAAKLITLIGSASTAGAVLSIIGIVLIGAILFGAIAYSMTVLYRNPKSTLLGATLGGGAATGIIFGIPGFAALIASSPIGWVLGATLAILVSAILGGVVFGRITDCCIYPDIKTDNDFIAFINNDSIKPFPKLQHLRRQKFVLNGKMKGFDQLNSDLGVLGADDQIEHLQSIVHKRFKNKINVDSLRKIWQSADELAYDQPYRDLIDLDIWLRAKPPSQKNQS